jgi:hypothetical protein
MRISLFSLVIVIFLTISTAAKLCPQGDLDGNCKVDWKDIKAFTDQWLSTEEEECPNPGCANFDSVNGINLVDFSILASQWLNRGIPLVINEFMASNNHDSGIHDPADDDDEGWDDWIEIYNFGDTPIDLAGMYLTDDLDEPTKWQISEGYPSQTTVPADGYLLIWADGQPYQGILHANFALKASGEQIGLYNTDGSTLIDGITFGEQMANISYGRYPDASDNFQFFIMPTPLADNNGTYLNFVSEIEVSHKRGFYESAFDLLLACDTNGATIRYTLDGTEPSETIGTVYTPGVEIPITTIKCLRAIAYKAGEKPSRVTHTYIFIDDVAQQPTNPPGWPSHWGTESALKVFYITGNIPSDYEMDPRVVNSTLSGYSIRDALLDIPTVCISMPIDDFVSTSENNGIYSNSTKTGTAWERKCSIEYIPLDGAEGFQYDCKIETHGGASRYPQRMQKHSLRLTFTSQYGPPKLEYPLFPESPVDTFNQLILRACFTDSWGLVSWDSGRYRPNDSQYIHDVWMKNSLGDMGQPTSHGNFVHLYVNGLYFGLHNLTERIAEDFFADHLGGEPEDWEINDDFSTAGTRWNAMMSINPSTEAGYTQIQNYLDVKDLADYMLLHFYADAEDWPSHNGFAAANAPSGDGRFRFFVWDQEIVLDGHGRASSRIDYSSGVGAIFQKMRTSAEFNLLFADRVQKHCFNGGALSVTGSQNRYLNIANMIDKAIVAESARWGDTRMKTQYEQNTTTIQQPSPLNDVNNDLYPPAPHGPDYYFTREDSWLVECNNVINNYIPYIHNTGSTGIIGVFRSKNLFPSIDAPVFNVNGFYKHGGYVSTSDTLTITDSCSTAAIYYTIDGNDPRVPFTGAISSSAIQYSGGFTLNKSTNLRARAYISSTQKWSALNEAVYEVGSIRNSLRITEIMYHPMDTSNPNDPNTEYIELKNIGANTINLNLVKFDKGIDFTFGPNTLTASQYILIVKNKNAFEAKYGTGKYIAGEYTGSLDNGGERIRLLDAVGTTILDFEYKDGWRSIVDGDGYSLTIIEPTNPDMNNWSKKDSWRASAYVNGSPGWADSGIIPNPGSIVINEVMSHSHDSNPDWIELYNTTASSINIGGWYLSDSNANPLKYRFATGTTIPAYGYIVVYEDVNFGSLAADPGRLIPFALSENGETVCLASALDNNNVLTGYREKEDFGASETGVSFGRYYKGSTDSFNFVAMDHNTPGQENAYPKVGPIVITEIMYNPDWPAGSLYENDQYEYIELHNISGSAVTLYDSSENIPWKFTDGIDYTFGSPPNAVTIPAGGRILVVKNPTAFNTRYSGLSGITYGPYDGWLDNAGEKVEISKPGDEDAGVRYYIRVDRVDYSDGSHPDDEPGDVDLWPTQADGAGKSLTRISTTLYGNDPNNWQAATPTLGS